MERKCTGQLRKGAHLLLGIDTPARFSPWAGKKSGAAIESVGETQVAIRRVIMPAFSPALITIMRSVLEDATTRVPVEQATTGTRAYLAELILKAAAGGLTS
jgi:hypothetical protein